MTSDVNPGSRSGYFQIYQDYNSKLLVALRRDSDGTVHSDSLVPSYSAYFQTEDWNQLSQQTRRELGNHWAIKAIIQCGEWTRVEWVNTKVNVPGLEYPQHVREHFLTKLDSPLAEIKSYEGDVHPVRRYFSDTGATVQRPRRVYLDIETDSRVPFSRKEEARILSYALVSLDGTVHSNVLQAWSNPAEKQLLESLWNDLIDYDQILAWNGDAFDFPVIQARTRYHRVSVEPRDWLYLDHLALFKRMNLNSAETADQKQSFALQAIATSLLGEGKEDFDASKTYQAWAAGGTSRDLLLKYNVKDSDLLRRIEDKTGFIELFLTLCEVCRCLPDSRSLRPTQQVDGYLLRLGQETSRHFPSCFHKDREERHEKYAGAFVLHPSCQGIQRDVHVCDFASMYPSIIISWNMSPETKLPRDYFGDIPHSTSPKTGIKFRTDTRGTLPLALDGILQLRKEWSVKQASLPPNTPEWNEAGRRSMAYKVASNSFYGVMGSATSRYSDPELGESITQSGAWLIEHTIEAAKAKGIETLYGDTDSIFCTNVTREDFSSFVQHCNEKLYPELLASQGCNRNTVKNAYEKQFRMLVLLSAKKYFGVYAHYKGKSATADSKPEVKGLEIKRGDAVLIARRLQEQLITQIVQDLPEDESVKRCSAILQSIQRKILDESLSLDEVLLARGLSRELTDYQPTPSKIGKPGTDIAHVRVAKILAERGEEVHEGTRIRYVVTDGSQSPVQVTPADDYRDNVDRTYLWEHLVYPPSQRVLEATFPSHAWNVWARVQPKNRHALKGQMPLFKEQMRPVLTSHKRGTLVVPPQPKSKPVA